MQKKYKRFPAGIDRARNTAWNRARAQAQFRGEDWSLSFEDFCELWTEERWPQRGRGIDCLCMSRLDPEGCWDRDNTVLIERQQHLKAKNRRQWGMSWQEFYNNAITFYD